MYQMSHTNFNCFGLTFMPLNNVALHVTKRIFINYKKVGTVDQQVSQMSRNSNIFI